MLVPPENFGLVEPGIYRCSKLESDNFPFLATLKLKSLVLLDAEKPPRLLNNFIDSNNIELFNLGGLKISNHHRTGMNDSSNKDEEDEIVDENSSVTSSSSRKISSNSNELEIITLNKKRNKNDQWMLIERNIISGAFELLLNKTKHNLLLIDSTSTLIGILRKLQKWNFNSILNEYRIYVESSNSNHYFAETFLEVIQTELISYEVDHLNQQLKQQQQQQQQDSEESNKIADSSLFKSPEFDKYGSRSIRKNSVDYDSLWEEDDTRSIDDEDIDEEFLSGSPQIPANLLKLVEQKKQEKSRSSEKSDNATTNALKINRSSRNNSFSHDLMYTGSRTSFERRRSSIDSRFLKFNNNKFRNQGSPGNPLAKSYEGSPTFRKLKDKDSKDVNLNDAEIIRAKYDFRYYKNLKKCPEDYENISVLKLKLPPDHYLPEWFIRGRNHWEESFKKLNQ